uniref:Ovule protein n=1 Tax=Romanomermis culicivorax TaxID=13658 RepID=A0A915KAT8_ROMCU
SKHQNFLSRGGGTIIISPSSRDLIVVVIWNLWGPELLRSPIQSRKQISFVIMDLPKLSPCFIGVFTKSDCYKPSTYFYGCSILKPSTDKEL